MSILIDSFVAPDEQECQLGQETWSVCRLFHLSRDLPVMDVPLEHLNIYHKYGVLTLREMVGHMKSVNNADLSYPIILDQDGEILDGRHRIMKALLQGEKTIKAVRFTKNPSPCRIESD